MKRVKLKEKGYKYIYVFDIYPADMEKIPIEIYAKEKMTDEEIIQQKESFKLTFPNPRIGEPRVIVI